MADNRIQFSIFSTFSGEGFKKANAALKTSARSGKDVLGAIRGIAGEAAKAGGALGKVAQGMGGIVDGVAHMGVMGGILGAASAAVDALAAHFKSAADEMVKEAKRAREEVERENSKIFAGHVEEFAQNWREGFVEAEKFARESINKDIYAAKLAQADESLAAADRSMKLTQMEAEKFSAVLKEQTDEGKALVEAQWNLKIAEEKAAAVRADGDAKHEAAMLAVVAAEHKREDAATKAAEAAKYIAEADKYLADWEGSHAENVQKAWKEVKAKRDAAQSALEKAQEDERKATEEVALAKKQAELVERQNKEARAKETQAIEACRASLKEVTDANQRNAEARDKQTEDMKMAEALKQQRTDVQAAGNARLRELDRQIEDAQKLAKESEAAKDATRAGMEADQRYHRGIGGEGYKYQTDADGNPLTLADWRRAQRYGVGTKDHPGRLGRNNDSAKKADAAAQRAYDAAKARRDAGKKLSPKEQKLLDDMDARKKERDGAKEAAEKEKAAREEKEKLEKKMALAVLDINKQLQKLGLK